MGKSTILEPRKLQWRMVIVLVALIVLPCICAAWLGGWRFFSFPLGTFLVWLGVPLGLIAVAMMIPSVRDDEATDS